MLDFWATWCGGCLTAIPVMEQLAKKYEKQGVVFFGVHTPDGDMDQIKKLQKVKGWTAPTAIDVGTSRAGGETIERYGVRGFPTVILIAPDGKIAFNSDDPAEDQQPVLARLQKLAESLDVPWPPEKWGEGEESAKQFNKLIFAMYSAEVDKALAFEPPLPKIDLPPASPAPPPVNAGRIRPFEVAVVDADGKAVAGQEAWFQAVWHVDLGKNWCLLGMRTMRAISASACPKRGWRNSAL